MINTVGFQSDWVGTVVDGEFPLLEWLGSSESGAVFRTELKGPQPQKAAIRLVLAVADDSQAKLNGWKAAAVFSHPHLMRLFHFGRCKVGTDDVLYVVTEYAEEALSQVLPERPLTSAEAKEMLAPLLDALSYVHAHSFLYGRLKPSKVMVVQDQMKLPVDSLHRVGSLPRPLSEPQIYDAPEKTTGAISSASDIWSLGITLVEALTQHPPLWDRSINSDPVVPGSVPQPFADMARKCVRREPERRCTLEEIHALLDPARPLAVKSRSIDEPVRPRPTKSPVEVVGATKSKYRVSLLIAAVFLMCIVVAAVLLHKTNPSPTVENRTTTPVPVAAPAPATVAPIQSSENSSLKGEVVERVMPDISPEANRSIHGKFAVKVRVSVDAKGDVSNAEFDSHGPSRYFANQALQATRSWKFKAAQVDGQPVSSEWILRFEFRKNRTDCDPVEITP